MPSNSPGRIERGRSERPQPVSDTGRFLAGLTALPKFGFNKTWSQLGKESSTRW